MLLVWFLSGGQVGRDGIYTDPSGWGIVALDIPEAEGDAPKE